MLRKKMSDARNEPNQDYMVNAEANTFFCFVELSSGFGDSFCQQLDNSIVGIRSTIIRVSQLLRQHDEGLWRHLEVTTKANIENDQMARHVFYVHQKSEFPGLWFALLEASVLRFKHLI